MSQTEPPMHPELPEGMGAPQPLGVQVICFLGGLAACPGMGWLLARIFGDLSEAAEIVLMIPFVLIFLGGYSLWMARLNAIAMDVLGRSVFKALFGLLMKRKRPENLEEVLPTKEKLLEMAVRAQKASSSFFLVAIPTSVFFSLWSGLFASESSALFRMASVGCINLLWGYLLYQAALRGYLPIMDE